MVEVKAGGQVFKMYIVLGEGGYVFTPITWWQTANYMADMTKEGNETASRDQPVLYFSTGRGGRRRGATHVVAF